MGSTVGTAHVDSESSQHTTNPNYILVNAAVANLPRNFQAQVLPPSSGFCTHRTDMISDSHQQHGQSNLLLKSANN